MALLPRLVGEARLGPANALLHTVQDLGIGVGPAIGAILLAVAPAWAAFLANGATFAVSALLISTMRRDARPPVVRQGAGHHLAGGLRAVRSTPFAVWLMAIVSMVEFTYGAQTVQLVVYAQRSLGFGKRWLRRPARGRRRRRIAERGRQRASLHEQARVGDSHRLRFAGVRYAARVRRRCRGHDRARGNGDRKRGTRHLRGGRRNDPRPHRPARLARADASAVAAMILGAVLASVLIASTSLRVSLLVLGAASLLVILVSLGLSPWVCGGSPSSSLPRRRSCPLPPGVDVVVRRSARSRLLRHRRRPRGRPSGR